MTNQTIALGSNPVLEIEHVGGDVIIEGWNRSDLQAQGDNVQIDQAREGHVISSAGDLNISAPRGTKLTVTFIGGDLKADNLSGPMEITFVGGDAILRNLTGQVTIDGMVGGDTKLENVSQVSMDAKKGARGHDISERITRKIEQAARRAEQKMRHAEIKIQNVENKVRHHGQFKTHIDTGRWKWNATPGSFSTESSSEPISDEERMTILKMLQEKKITSEQADKLLSALEGGDS